MSQSATIDTAMRRIYCPSTQLSSLYEEKTGAPYKGKLEYAVYN
jgi:hypothetical protein